MADEKKKLKMAVISGASHALKFRNEKPHATDAEIIAQVSKVTTEILDKIDN